MVSFWLHFCLTSLSCVAAASTAFFWFRARKLLAAASMRSLGQLSMEVAELRSLYESLLTSHRRMHARIGMREGRERRREEEAATVVDTSTGNGADEREKLRVQARQKGLLR